MDRSGEAEARAVWWAELADGDVAPYRPGTVSRGRQMHVRGALGFMDQRRERQAELVAQRAREAEAESTLPLPPTTVPAHAMPADAPAA